MELPPSTPLSKPSDQNAVGVNKVYDSSFYTRSYLKDFRAKRDISFLHFEKNVTLMFLPKRLNKKTDEVSAQLNY